MRGLLISTFHCLARLDLAAALAKTVAPYYPTGHPIFMGFGLRQIGQQKKKAPRVSREAFLVTGERSLIDNCSHLFATGL
jgi:hypothetical protein